MTDTRQLMEPYKFQTDSTGTKLMLYNESGNSLSVLSGDDMHTVRKALSMPRRMGKVYAMAYIDNKGKLHLGKRLPDQPW